MQNRLVMTIFTTLAPLFTWLITFLIPGRNSRTLTTECRNKCRIMTLVQGLKSYMAPDGSTSLQSIVEQCYALGDFPALWAVEGAGKDLAEWHMKRNPNPERMLVDAPLDPEWNKSLLMLHAGIGLGFARFYVEPLNPNCSKEELRAAVPKRWICAGRIRGRAMAARRWSRWVWCRDSFTTVRFAGGFTRC